MPEASATRNDTATIPVADDKLSAFIKSLGWGTATFPVMLATGSFFGTLLRDTDVSSNWVYVLMFAVCGICGYGAGRNWTRVSEALFSSLPMGCGIGAVIWIVFGTIATLGQTPNAKWYGVPEALVSAIVFILASGVGAARRGRSAS